MIPPFKTFMLPVLKYLEDGNPHSRVEIRMAMAELFGISEEELKEKSDSGKLIVKGNIDWAVAFLKQAGLIEQPEKGNIVISKDGATLLQNPPAAIDNAYLSKHYPAFKAFKHGKHKQPKVSQSKDSAMTMSIKSKLTLEEAQTTIQLLTKAGLPVPSEVIDVVKQAGELRTKNALVSGFSSLHEALQPIDNNITVIVEFGAKDWRAKVVNELFAYDSLQGTEIVEVQPQQEVPKKPKVSSKSKGKKKKAKTKRRPPLDFYEMGFVDGDVLVYKGDPAVKVEVRAANKVLFNGEQLSLTKLTMQLKGLSQAIQPTSHWLFEGRNLADIYNEIYPKD